MQNNKILAISGNFRVGKDSVFNILSRFLPVKRVAFADSLKNATKDLCWDLLKIDVWTEDLKEKEVIRPILVCVGNTARARNENVWVDKVRPLISEIRQKGQIACVTDARFKNEATFIQDELQGLMVYVDRVLPDGTLQPPANQSEAENSPIMKSLANVHVIASNLQELEIQVKEKVLPLVEKFQNK